MGLDVYHLASYNGILSILVSTEVSQIWQQNDDLWMWYWCNLENTQLQLGVQLKNGEFAPGMQSTTAVT